MEAIRQVLKRCKNEEYVIDIKGAVLTKEEKNDLFDKANEDYSMYDLCLEFNKDYLAIIKCYEEVLKEKERLSYIDGNKAKTWTKEDEENLIKWKEQGLSNKIVSMRLGKTESSIRSRISVINNRNKK